jgi:CheY-like chemotaxis protein
VIRTPDRQAHDRGARPRVLVVEDDADVCEALRLILGDAGYAVATVAHGAAALDLVKQHRPALIFVDLRLPIMDGFSFVDQYRRTPPPHASLVLLSAAKDLPEIARQVRADAYVRKPFDADEILSIAARCLAEG